ncbi:MAG: Nramp family divalent metal transporter [Armatimonadetes bacterium]|nr:Nramp family divalent metal transporter [Armatimonadota bacterium]
MVPGSADHLTRSAAHAVLAGSGERNRLARLLPFLGPAFIASVAYVDPGNFATNIQAGARYGYLLLWVVVASNLMAMLVQALSAKLGIATGLNLAEHCRDSFSQPVVWALWLLAELVAMATDLAEFLGAALGFQLLFGIPLMVGAGLTAVSTFAILALERHGFRRLEAVIVAMVAVIAGCYLLETILDRPDWRSLAVHALVPRFEGTESVLLASGILGATVMPHVIYLHSALTQQRVVVDDPRRKRKLYRYEKVDVFVAMAVAGSVNAAMLIMAAATFHRAGQSQVGTIEQAHATLGPLLGEASRVAFGLSLLASGLSSSAVGTMAGQVIMQGFLRRSIPLNLRRAITMLPSLVIIAAGVDPTRSLVISQVILSFGIPFALIPLIWFTARRETMGALTNRRSTTIVAGLVTALICSLNGFLIWQLAKGA